MALPLSHKEAGLPALHTRLVSKNKARTTVASTGKTTTLKKYAQAVKCLQQRHAIDENIAYIENIATNIQQHSKTPSQYTDELMAKILQCRDVCKKIKNFNKISMNGLGKPIRQRISGY